MDCLFVHSVDLVAVLGRDLFVHYLRLFVCLFVLSCPTRWLYSLFGHIFVCCCSLFLSFTIRLFLLSSLLYVSAFYLRFNLSVPCSLTPRGTLAGNFPESPKIHHCTFGNMPLSSKCTMHFRCSFIFSTHGLYFLPGSNFAPFEKVKVPVSSSAEYFQKVLLERFCRIWGG